MASSLLWLTPLLSFAVGLGMLLVRDRRVLATLDVAGSLAVLGLTLAITGRVVGGGPVSALGVLRADDVAVLFLAKKVSRAADFHVAHRQAIAAAELGEFPQGF